VKEMRDISIFSEFKAVLLEMVDEKTTNTIFNGFTFNNKIFSLSISAQINWSNLFNIPDSFFPLTLSCKDESTYSLSLENRQAFYLTAMGAKHTILMNGTNLKQQIISCSTIEELQTIKDSL
jgi:hypothetical protein